MKELKQAMGKEEEAPFRAAGRDEVLGFRVSGMGTFGPFGDPGIWALWGLRDLGLRLRFGVGASGLELGQRRGCQFLASALLGASHGSRSREAGCSSV